MPNWRVAGPRLGDGVSFKFSLIARSLGIDKLHDKRCEACDSSYEVKPN